MSDTQSANLHILNNVAKRLKMTGGTPEVRSDKSLTLLTFDGHGHGHGQILTIWLSEYLPLD